MLRDNDLQNMIADFPGIRQQLQVRFAPHLSACVHLSVCLTCLSDPSVCDRSSKPDRRLRQLWRLLASARGRRSPRSRARSARTCKM